MAPPGRGSGSDREATDDAFELDELHPRSDDEGDDNDDDDGGSDAASDHAARTARRSRRPAPRRRASDAESAASFALYTPDEERRVVAKFDRRLTVFVAFLYMLSFLDRSST